MFKGLKIESQADLACSVAGYASNLTEARIEHVGDDSTKKVPVKNIQKLCANFYPHILSDKEPFPETKIFSNAPWIAHIGGESRSTQGKSFVIGKHTGANVAVILETGGRHSRSVESAWIKTRKK